MEKKLLSETIKARLIRKFGGLKAASRNLPFMSYDTLRQNLSKNTYFEGDLLKLCPLINLPTTIDDLRAKYEFTIKKAARGLRRQAESIREGKQTSWDAFEIIDGRMARINQIFESARDVVPRFFEAMGAGDLLAIFIADEFPGHWSGGNAADWAGSIADALGRGAMIVYF